MTRLCYSSDGKHARNVETTYGLQLARKIATNCDGRRYFSPTCAIILWTAKNRPSQIAQHWMNYRWAYRRQAVFSRFSRSRFVLIRLKAGLPSCVSLRLTSFVRTLLSDYLLSYPGENEWILTVILFQKLVWRIVIKVKMLFMLILW